MKTVIDVSKSETTNVLDWLIALLDRTGAYYEIIEHRRDYGAARTAADTDTSRLEFAKTIVVEIDGRYVMAVLPASHQIDLARLAKAFGAPTAKLAPEPRLAALFPDCEVGAAPPFGPHYGMAVAVSAVMAMDEHISFNAGSHDFVIRMQYADFERLVQPRVTRFSHKQ